jgi:UDP-N-acetylmuramoylalanine--D-glutamate ligase
MRIRDLKGKKVAVWGLGKEGLATLRVLRKAIPEQRVTVLNDSTLSGEDADKLSELGVESVLTGTRIAESVSAFDIIVKSPGISRYRPEVKNAENEGVLVTSSTALWFGEHPNETTVCVTGTKGKSTTSSLISYLLSAIGIRTALVGNIGAPILDMVTPDPLPDIWVIELSSYQTSDFEGSPSVSVLLNLYPEHLDWHRSAEIYYRDKLNLFAHTTTGFSVINYLDPVTNSLRFNFNNLVYFNNNSGIHSSNGFVCNGEKKLINVEGIGLRGEHNLSNVCAALTAIQSVGVKPERCLSALCSFEPLPHRLMMLGDKDGVLYVDDSISTIPQSAIAALKSFAGRPITILLGGYDRGLDFSELAECLAEGMAFAIVTMPDTGQKLAHEIRDAIRRKQPSRMPALYEARDLTEAVYIAQSVTPVGGVILLSPAAPSYGKFKNYEERGEMFADAAGIARL